MKKLLPLLFLSATLTAAAAPAKMPRKASSVATPQVLAATDITEEGFTANWKPVAGADGYAVFVTSREEVSVPGTYTVLYENFNLVSQGSVIEPVFLDEMTSYLDEYGLTITPDWTVSQCILAGGKISGVIWTPYIDVRADEGRYRVTLTVQGYAGQEIVVVSQGSKEDRRRFTLADNGNNTVSLDFDNGTQDTFLRIVDNGFPDDTEGMYIDKIAYLDDIEVTQQFKAGDDIYRLVAVGETESSSLAFPTLPYRYGETRLYYDLYATSVYYPDPDDEWTYEMDYSDFSPKQEVLLVGHTGIADASADSDEFSAGYGSLQFSGEGSYDVHDLAGRKVAAGRGAAELRLAPGLYIARSQKSVAKIVIK